jgi:4-amino-4-deoxy-L-arabinose transferase-like glycosyltransferase
VLVVQALVGALAVVPTYLLGRRLFDRPAAALIASVGVTLNWALVLQAQRFYSEAVYTPILLVAILALYWAIAAPTWRRFLVAGGALGVANLVRPTALFLPLAFVVVFAVLWRNWRKVASAVLPYAAGLVIVITPWIVKDAAAFHAVLPLSTSGAALWQASPVYYHLYRQGRPYYSIFLKELNPAANGGRNPWTSVQDDRYFNEIGLRSIEAEPLTYVHFSLLKSLWFWVGQPGADWNEGRLFDPRKLHSPTGHGPLYVGVECCFRWREVAAVMAARLLPFAALGGGIVLHARWRQLLPIYGMLGYFTLFHGLLWAELRYEQPLVPFLTVIVAGALVLLWSRFRRPSEDGSAVVSGRV